MLKKSFSDLLDFADNTDTMLHLPSRGDMDFAPVVPLEPVAFVAPPVITPVVMPTIVEQLPTRTSTVNNSVGTPAYAPKTVSVPAKVATTTSVDIANTTVGQTVGNSILGWTGKVFSGINEQVKGVNLPTVRTSNEVYLEPKTLGVVALLLIIIYKAVK